jgi:flagellar basal body-associated protein FliL
MASNKLYIIIVVVLIIVLSIVGYSAYMSFLPTTTTTTSSTTITTGPVSINAYWLNTNITLGESVTFVVKTVSSDFTAEIWKVNAPDELVAQYQGKGGLSQDFTPPERSTYYIKVRLLDGTDIWEQQVDYRLKVS